jgi:hypothetical protein
MEATLHQTVPVSNARLWSARIMMALAVLFLLFNGVLHIMSIPPVQESFIQLGYPSDIGVVLGIIQLACLVLYLIPRTSILGVILLTGYLGGAIATHVRIGNPLFSHSLFPVYIGILLWGGLFLMDNRLRNLIPLRR